MNSPASELQKLLDLRDAGELTEAEFARARERVLHTTAPPNPREAGVLDRLSANLLTLVIAIGVLVGATTLIALTEAGAIALLTLAILAVLIVGIWLFKESSWF